ncbi:PQQ-binding-like beta-propeller repeat protein [Longispora sp. K20-0274]|uniref:outer membrane protein assembly factor BamB family protein n=1 Tax=Longispora sp. K20-0274 TaxID=3088255 RepID=UPI00399B1939
MRQRWITVGVCVAAAAALAAFLHTERMDPPSHPLPAVPGPGLALDGEPRGFVTRTRNDIGYAAWVTGDVAHVGALRLATNSPAWPARGLGDATGVEGLLAFPDALVLTVRRNPLLSPSDRLLVVLDPATGATRWTADYFDQGSDLAFYEDVVVLGSRAARSTRGLDWRTGAERWSLPDPATGEVTAAPISGPDPAVPLQDTRLFQIVHHDTLHTYDVRTGTLTGTLSLAESRSDAVVVGNTLVVNEFRRAVAYDVTGATPARTLVRADDQHSVTSVAGCGAGRICLILGGLPKVRPSLRAFDAATGRELWRAESPESHDTTIGTAGTSVFTAGALYSPTGALLSDDRDTWNSSPRPSLGHVTDGRLIELAYTESYSSDTAVRVSWVSTADGARTRLGSVTGDPRSCSWTERFLLCARRGALGVWALA